MNMNRKAINDAQTVADAIALVIVVIILMVLEVWIGWWLWGVIAVAIFGLPELTFVQFFGLNVLLSILIPHNVSTSKKD